MTKSTHAGKKTRSKKRKILFIILGSLLIILIALRIALPYILLKVVNRELTRVKGYSGHVNDIDVALIRGAYTLKQTKLDKTGGVRFRFLFFRLMQLIFPLNGRL